MSTEEEDNVIHFFGKLPPLETRRKPREAYGLCWNGHKGLVLDDHRRMIECKECGKVIDPFDWLLEKARRKENTLGTLKDVDQSIREKTAELREINKELKNAKSRLKRTKTTPPQ